MGVYEWLTLPGWFITILLFICSLCLYSWQKRSYFRNMGYYTKPCTPILGDLPLLISKGLRYTDADMVKKNGKVFGTFIGHHPNLIVADADMIEQICVKHFSKFSEREFLYPVKKKWHSAITIASGDHWRYIRAVISPTFSSGKMRKMAPILFRCINSLQDILDEKIDECPEGFDIVPVLEAFTLDLNCSTIFGLKENNQRKTDNPFIKYCHEFLTLRVDKSINFLVKAIFPELHNLLVRYSPTDLISTRCWNFFRGVTTHLFEERRRGSVHNDLLQLMVNSHVKPDDPMENRETLAFKELKEHGLTDEEILMNSMIFMAASFGTTSATLNWLMFDIATHPDIQEKLIEEIDREVGEKPPTYDNVFQLKYLSMVVKETFRFHVPGPRISRKAQEDVDVCGVKIHKGVICVFPISALHFMEDYWDKPYEYNPERFAPENKANIFEHAYMPFGHGPRDCVGKRLAIYELHATAVSLLQRFRFYKTDETRLDMPVISRGIDKPGAPIKIRLERRTKPT